MRHFLAKSLAWLRDTGFTGGGLLRMAPNSDPASIENFRKIHAANVDWNELGRQVAQSRAKAASPPKYYNGGYIGQHPPLRVPGPYDLLPGERLVSIEKPTPDCDTRFDKAESLVADLYPEYKGWRCRTLALELDYQTVDGPGIVVETPRGYLAALMYPPDNHDAYAPVFLLLPLALFDTPAHDGARITPAMLEEALEGRAPTYVLLPGTTTTVCSLQLKGGLVTTGQSACIDKRNFDWDKGKEISLKHAQDAAYAALAARATGNR